MPNTVCDACRLIMDYCYRFKQMCKKADTALKQYPLTGIWPAKHELPLFPTETISGVRNHYTYSPKHLDSNIIDDQTIFKQAKSPIPPKLTPVILNKRKADGTPSSITVPLKIKKENGSHVLNLIASHDDDDKQPSPAKLKSVPMPPQPKLLNRSVKILNKQAPRKEPKITFQNVSTDYGDDNMVTEIVFADPFDTSNDPTNAEPVETDVFPCNQCARSFPLRQLLDLHMANHTRDRKFQCETCEKAFFSKYDLGKHLLIHSGEKPFQCVVCQKAFSRSTLLRRHEKIHSDQPKFLCVYCERPFLSKEELEKHTTNHLKNRPYVCTICNKGFAFKQGLERHEVVHSVVQPFQCDHCEQSFSTQSKLARHLTAHAGSRPYPCRVCPKSYLLSHHLTRHMRSHKELDIAPNYKCAECNELFETRDDLIYHSAVHATENLTCPLCKDEFDDIDEVTEHIKSHTEGDQFACEFCELIFISEDKLRAHCDEVHASELAEYEKDDLARKSSQRKQEANGQQSAGDPIKSESSVEVLEEFIISDAIIVDENGDNIVDKQLISSNEFAEFGEGQLEFEQDEEEQEGELFTLEDPLDENDSDQGGEIEIKHEPIASSGQRKIKSYFPSTRKAAATKQAISPKPQVQARPAARSAARPTPSPPKKLVTPTQVAKTIKVMQKSPAPVVSVAKKLTGNAKVLNVVAPKVNQTVEVRNVRPSRSSVSASPSTSVNPQTPQGKLQIPTSGVRSAKTPAPVVAKPATRLSRSPPGVSGITAMAKKNPADLVDMKIDGKVVKVQQIRVTKAQAEAMAKEGKISLKGGQMILKQSKK